MATLIETEESAKRLARVILSDVQLYNKELIASGGDLTAALHEGRHHFKSRVVASMYGVFDQVAVERKLLAGASGLQAAPPLEKTPSVVTLDQRPTPLSMEAAPTLVQGTPVLPPEPEPEPAAAPPPVEATPTPVLTAQPAAPAPAKPAAATPAPPAPVRPSPAPAKIAPAAAKPTLAPPRPTPAPAHSAPAYSPPKQTATAPRPMEPTPPPKPARVEPPMERTPPPIPERAKAAPVNITITATPPPPAPNPWVPPTSPAAPVFAAAPLAAPAPAAQHNFPAPAPERAAETVGDAVVPNLKPPFPWIKIILLLGAVVAAVAGVVHLTR